MLIRSHGIADSDTGRALFWVGGHVTVVSRFERIDRFDGRTRVLWWPIRDWATSKMMWVQCLVLLTLGIILDAQEGASPSGNQNLDGVEGKKEGALFNRSEPSGPTSPIRSHDFKLKGWKTFFHSLGKH